MPFRRRLRYYYRLMPRCCRYAAAAAMPFSLRQPPMITLVLRSRALRRYAISPYMMPYVAAPLYVARHMMMPDCRDFMPTLRHDAADAVICYRR